MKQATLAAKEASKKDAAAAPAADVTVEPVGGGGCCAGCAVDSPLRGSQPTPHQRLTQSLDYSWDEAVIMEAYSEC